MQSISTLAAVAFLGAVASAQQGLDIQRCSTIQDAGTLSLVSGVLTPANGVLQFVTEASIYDNTCPTPSFTSLLSGNTNLDEGRLPSTTSPAPNIGTFNKYRVTKFVIGYCTRELATTAGGPGAQVTINFWESYTPCTAIAANPAPVATFALTGLPASATLGTLSCYTLTIDLAGGGEFYMLADGNGVNDGTDLFGFSYSFPNQTGTTTATVGGPIVTGTSRRRATAVRALRRTTTTRSRRTARASTTATSSSATARPPARRRTPACSSAPRPPCTPAST